MRLTHGDYAVERDCCTSGQCLECWPLPRNMPKPGPKRVIQINGLSLASAKQVARNFEHYRAAVVRETGRD